MNENNTTRPEDDVMTVEEILEALRYNTGSFPREAIEAAARRREEITPELLATLANLDPKEIIDDNAGYMLHIYALYLLAQFREKKAYPLMVRFFSTYGDASLNVTGDFVTEDLDRALASVACGDTTLIRKLIADPNVNQYVRSAAIEALRNCVIAGDADRDEVMAYYKTLFEKFDADTDTSTWFAVAKCCVDLYPEEVQDKLREVVNRELGGWVFHMDSQEVDDVLALTKEEALAELRSRKTGTIDDTVAEMQGWACFKNDRKKLKPGKSSAAKALTRQRRPKPAPGTPVAPERKVRRNDPCPCGSGKKYKRCCGKK